MKDIRHNKKAPDKNRKTKKMGNKRQGGKTKERV
jgi:hypothetical protein